MTDIWIIMAFFTAVVALLISWAVDLLPLVYAGPAMFLCLGVIATLQICSKERHGSD